MLGKHLVKTWSTTQPRIALSVAEAEFYPMVEAATRATGLQQMLCEWGIQMSVPNLYTDSSSGKSFASRRGVGKIRHIDVKELWLQQEVKDGRVKLFKVAGDANPADILTKYLDAKDIQEKAWRVAVEFNHSMI